MRPISVLSSVDKNTIKVMNQRCSQYQLLAREFENLGGDSNSNPDADKFLVAYKDHIRCSQEEKPASFSELEKSIKRENSNSGKKHIRY